MPVQGVASNPSTANDPSIVFTGTVENVSIAVANTEQSHTFPAGSRSIQVKARGGSKLKMSFSPGTSGTTYQTIWPGAVYSQENIGATSTTIYFQSPVAGLVVEMTSWV